MRMSGSRSFARDRTRRDRRILAIGGMVVAALLIGLAAGAALGRQVLPNSSRPAPGLASSATAGVPGVGPTRVARGVPVGYERSARGAAQAAGNYLAVLGGQLALDPVALDAALARVADPSALTRLQASATSSLQVEESLWGILSAHKLGKRVLLTQTPVAYRVDAFALDQATVSVWLVTTVGVENHQRLETFWAVSSATLAWVDGDWRLRSVDAGSPAHDVVPASMQTPTPTGGVPTGLSGFAPYGT
jgi:hypothetical protein